MIMSFQHFQVIEYLHTDITFQKRLEGTKVTVESFMAWKRQFDEERLAMMAKVKKEVG